MRLWMVLAASVFLFLSWQVTAEEKAQEFSGSVEKTQSGVPRLVVGETHYRLKAAEKAPDAVKETLKKIGAGELTGKFKVTGKTEKEGEKIWILVETIEKVTGDGDKKEANPK